MCCGLCFHYVCWYVEVLMKCFFNWAEFYVLTEIYGNNMQKLKITYYLETESYGLTPTPTKKELVISWETKIGKQNKKTAVS